MENTSIILTDLDGTLFRNDKTISNHTIQVIQKAQAKGIRVGISTARAIESAEEFLGDFKPDFYVANGGALVVVDNREVYSCQFTLEETRKMLKAAYEVCGDDVEMTLDNSKALYWNRPENERGDNFTRPTSEFSDFKDFKFPAMKICVAITDEEKAKQIASCIGLENVDIKPFSDIPWYKFSKADATKEKAIQVFSDYLKVPVSQMVAFGDDFTDIGMLKLCGTGVAMENAIPQVKEAADEITLSNMEDGVAVWIEKNLL